MSDTSGSLWYKFQSGPAASGLQVCAATGKSGNVQLMCIPCGHVYLDGKPFTDESDHIDSGILAKALYEHRCDVMPKPDPIPRSRGRAHRVG